MNRSREQHPPCEGIDATHPGSTRAGARRIFLVLVLSGAIAGCGEPRITDLRPSIDAADGDLVGQEIAASLLSNLAYLEPRVALGAAFAPSMARPSAPVPSRLRRAVDDLGRRAGEVLLGFAPESAVCPAGGSMTVDGGAADPDGDGIPTTLSITYAGCLSVQGSVTVGLDGFVVLRDLDPAVAGLAFRYESNLTVGADADDARLALHTAESVDAGAGTVAGQAFGMTIARSSDLHLSDSITGDVHDVHERVGLAQGYTPSGPWAPGSALVAGRLALAGTADVTVDGRRIVAVATTAGSAGGTLSFDPRCDGSIDQGTVSLASQDADATHVLSLTWDGCGAFRIHLDGRLVGPVRIASPREVDPLIAPEVTVAGDAGSTHGIFDAALWYPAGSPIGLMTYSSVPGNVLTRLAASVDGGASWHYVRDVNANTPASITNLDGDPALCGGVVGRTCDGRMTHEVSSIVYDPTDPDPAKVWKVFTHTYFQEGEKIFYHLGWISLFTARSPEQTWTGSRVLDWDFFRRTTQTLGGGTAPTNVNAILGMEDCLAVTEPGAAVLGDSIYLALGCVTADSGIRIDLLRSETHGASWVHVSRLLSNDDARAVGSVNGRINAPSLLTAGARLFLSATPDGHLAFPSDPAVGYGTGYASCQIFEFADPAAGQLVRTADGQPVVRRAIAAAGGRFSGACTADLGAHAMGYVIAVAREQGPIFRIYDSGVQVP